MNSFRTTSRSALICALLFLGAFAAYAANPTIFSIGQVVHPNGIVATPDRLLVTSQDQPLDVVGPPAVYHTNIYSLDSVGNATLFSTIADATVGLQEVYLSAAPGTEGGWVPFDIYACRGNKVYKVPAAPGPSTLFATLPAPAGDRLHCGISFDHIGNYGFDMIVTTEGDSLDPAAPGAVWRVTSAGGAIAAPFVTLPWSAAPNANVTEGPAATPTGFSGADGELLVTQELNDGGKIIRINNAAVASDYLTNFGEVESIHIVPPGVCDFSGTQAGFFTTDFFNNAIIGYPASDFNGLGGNAIAPIEFTSNGNNLKMIDKDDATVSDFDAIAGDPAVVHEGSTFVECGPADMPLRKHSTDESIPAPDDEFTFGLFPRGDSSFTNPPLGYNAGAADKGAAVTVTAPNDLSVPVFPFFASICEIDFPAGWTFSNFTATFTGGVGNSVSAPYQPAGEANAEIHCIDLVINNGTELVELDAFDTPHGRIIVDKVTIPSGSAQSFAFLTTGTGYSGFSLTDAAAANNQQVAPGSYTVAETVPSGWDQASAVCDNGETIDSIDVGPGETITCTFTNRQRGNIVVRKDTLPTDDGVTDFTFNPSWSETNFTLKDGGTNSASGQNLVPGTYGVVEESIPADYSLTSIECVSSQGGAANTTGIGLVLDPGETITCTFTNTRQGEPEACSPGYWKQPHHFFNYVNPPVDPLTTKYGTIFVSAPVPWKNMTFPQAIGSGGGGFNVLVRHSGAAFLNSLKLAGYGLTSQKVIELTNNAFIGGVGSGAYHLAISSFEKLLEDENCPLGRAPLPERERSR